MILIGLLIYKTRSKFGWSKSGEFSLINSEFLSHMVSPRVATNHPSRTNRNKRCRRSTELEGSQLPRELGDTQDWSWKILVKMWTMILHSFCVEETCAEWNISGKFPGRQATSIIAIWRSIWEGFLAYLEQRQHDFYERKPSGLAHLSEFFEGSECLCTRADSWTYLS